MSENYLDLEMDLLQVHSSSNEGTPRNNDAMDHIYKNAPVLTGDAAKILGPHAVPQRAVYGRILSQVIDGEQQSVDIPKLYVNTNAPFSAVICGLQGSGKSHSTSVLLESCLIRDQRLGSLPKPLSAIVFNFDAAGTGGQARPCEAAYLSTMDPNRGGATFPPSVTVLVLPNCVDSMKQVYSNLPNVEVKPLHFSSTDIGGESLLSMMKLDSSTQMPLYMDVVMTVLRDMKEFSLERFRTEIEGKGLNPGQKAMLNLRLSLLESCLKDGNQVNRVSAHFHRGHLTIIDLSSPFMDSSSACGFFNIILGLFLKAKIKSGKIIVLDEAHKYLGDGGNSEKLTESLLSVVRQERHLNARVVISTQEPTVVPPKFLELSSFVIVHRFSSPQWLHHLVSHVSIPKASQDEIFSKILSLQTGQALVFTPAGVGVSSKRSNDGGPGASSWFSAEPSVDQIVPFGQGYLTVHSRQRITLDGGQTLVATAAHVQASRVDGTRTTESPAAGASKSQNGVVASDAKDSRPVSILTTAKASASSTKARSAALLPKNSPFLPLLEILQLARTEEGHERLLWSEAATRVKKRSKSAYTGKFRPYVEAAESAGLVVCERDSSAGSEWVRLKLAN
ncbi:hypothetical protein AX16_004915 [Volvariella volvacea WC 439]|nr:hypothetical protein AX16_004915 [Volvariella volvacea WC 439]